MGHKDIASTMVYLHLQNHDLVGAILKLVTVEPTTTTAAVSENELKALPEGGGRGHHI